VDAHEVGHVLGEEDRALDQVVGVVEERCFVEDMQEAALERRAQTRLFLEVEAVFVASGGHNWRAESLKVGLYDSAG